MKSGIRLHLAKLSLLNTVRELVNFGVQCNQKVVHDWIQKPGLQPSSDESPNQVAFDETVIHIDAQKYWLYPVMDAESKNILHTRLFSTTTKALTELFGDIQRKQTSTTYNF